MEGNSKYLLNSNVDSRRQQQCTCWLAWRLLLSLGWSPWTPCSKTADAWTYTRKRWEQLRFSWVLFIRETVPKTALARVTMNDYLSPKLIFNLMMEHEGTQIVFTANTISSRASLFEVIWSIKLPQLGQEILGLCLYGLFHWYLDNVRVSFQDYF